MHPQACLQSTTMRAEYFIGGISDPRIAARSKKRNALFYAYARRQKGALSTYAVLVISGVLYRFDTIRRLDLGNVADCDTAQFRLIPSGAKSPDVYRKSSSADLRARISPHSR